MKLSLAKIESLCQQQGLSVARMLREAGVSPNAFYALGRKESALPRSLNRISERLEVPASAFLDEVPTASQRMMLLAAESNRIAKRHRSVDRDNVRHTLLLLDEKPIERLRRALRRGRSINLR